MSKPSWTRPSRASTLTDAGAAQQIHHPLLEDTGPDAGQHVLGAAVFDDDRVDARAMEELPEQEAGRAGPHDGNLDARGRQRRPSSL